MVKGKKDWRAKPRNVAPPPDVDRDWFFARMGEKQLSLRGLAKLMGLDAAALSRRLNGAIHISLEEATDLARHLDVPFQEVVKRAGVNAPADTEAAVPVTGWLDANGELASRSGRGPRHVPRPTRSPKDTEALRVEAPDHPTDGWVLFYVPSKRVEPEAVGRLSVVGVSGAKVAVRVVAKGSVRGTWRLEPLWGGAAVMEAALQWGAPVIGIRC